MPEFLVEIYEPRSSAHVAPAGVDVVRSLYVPEDEVCLHLVRAESREAVGAALRRADVAYDRIVEAVGEANEREEA